MNAFSFGPRNCVGRKSETHFASGYGSFANGCSLAYHEMRLILASVLVHFEIELCPESENWMDQQTHFLWDKKPLMVKLKLVKVAR
jgi:cytochrome P450